VVALFMLAVGLTPLRVLPRPVGMAVYEHREPLIYAGLVTALGVGLGLLITLAGS
jgi:hypothetical protein